MESVGWDRAAEASLARMKRDRLFSTSLHLSQYAVDALDTILNGAN